MPRNTNTAGDGRSQATGVKMGKGARRALSKNADCIDNFLSIVQSARTIDELSNGLCQDALTLARVTRSTGAGRLEVTALNIEACALPSTRATTSVAEECCSVPICGTLKFKGASRKKTDRANCMCTGDVIVLRGGLASGKMSAAAASVVRRNFERFGMVFPGGFFASTVDTPATEEAGGFEFDRSEELAAEEAEVAAMRAETARARAARAGGAAATDSDCLNHSDDALDIDVI